ncbi:MAG TPA: type 4a pilus biogenesis protein PilO [Capsulimonadaceae bacterium]|jgi:Tfp pilus assembly protein PilO
MINFKNKDEILPSTIILLSIIIMAATLAFMLLVPTPKPIKPNYKSLRDYTKRIASAKASQHTFRERIAPRIWSGDADTVSASVLSLLSNRANEKGVKLGAFRPQRAQPLAGVTEFPFIVQVTGSYSGVHGIMASLDAPGSRVVLRSVQVSSSQDAGTEVTVTLGLSAYVASDPLLEPNGGDHA